MRFVVAAIVTFAVLASQVKEAHVRSAWASIRQSISPEPLPPEHVAVAVAVPEATDQNALIPGATYSKPIQFIVPIDCTGGQAVAQFIRITPVLADVRTLSWACVSPVSLNSIISVR